MENDSTHTHHTSFDTTHHHTQSDVHHHQHSAFDHSLNHGIPPESIPHSPTPTFMDSSDSNQRRDQQKTIFSAESLQLFLATAGHLEAGELTKAKELYIRNAISEYHAAKKKLSNSWITLGLHLLIPIFWPMLYGAHRSAKIELEATKTRIQNALEVWKNELGSTHSDLTVLLNTEL